READCLQWVDGEWALAPNASLASITTGLPDSLEGVVLSRIDRLPEAHKLTLRVASVIGHTFTLDPLARVHPMQLSDEELFDQTGTLEARDFTHLEGAQAALHSTYIFKHNVTHDVAYDTLLHDQRKQLHRSVSETLESLSPDDVGRLAYHAFAGEDWPRSLH